MGSTAPSASPSVNPSANLSSNPPSDPPSPSSPGSGSSIAEAFARQVAAAGDREALWSRGEGLRLTFGELDRRAGEWCRRLDREEGRPVAVATGNGAVFCELFLALRRLGVPVVAMDGALDRGEKLDLCRRLGVATLLHRDGPVEPLAGGVGRTRTGAEPVTPPPGTALVKLTSGSTGEPKGHCFSERSLLVGIDQIARGMGIDAGDRVLMAIPLSHSYGFDNGVLSLLVVGTPLVLEPSFYPASILTAVERSGATFLPLVPPLVRALGEVPWPEGLALRTVICAGGVLLPEAARRFRRASGRPVHNFYGSTETGGICYERRPEEPEAEGTVGEPLPGVTVELDDGRPRVISGANRTGVLGRDREPIDRPVWTGDTAEWTPEGRLRLTGRSAEILNVGGRKVPAARLEEALRELPGVRQAAVVGVEDPARGDRVVAFLVADRWPVDTSSLPASLRPRELRRLDSLPHTPRGKLDRRALRRLAV
jgi:acyl-CoA synthetase (AMP-forming)/AMP-acid ligase II